MNDTAAKRINEKIKDFHLPRYQEITDVGLFLDQTVRIIESYLLPFQDMGLTASMISNYVKHKLIDHPVKKLYGRDQIAMLLFIAIAKTVLPLEDVRKILIRQRQEYPNHVAYDCFCDSFEKTLKEIFSGGSMPAPPVAFGQAAPAQSALPAVSSTAAPAQSALPEESDLLTTLRYLLTAASCRLFLEMFMAEAFPGSM